MAFLCHVKYSTHTDLVEVITCFGWGIPLLCSPLQPSTNQVYEVSSILHDQMKNASLPFGLSICCEMQREFV